MDNASKLEIHYFLRDHSHSLDALLRNKCEADFLAVAYEIISELDLPITLEAEALAEGGLKDLWKFVGENSNQLTVLLLLVTAIFTYQLIPDSELTELKKEETRLSIEKLKKELKESEHHEDTIEEAAIALSQVTKIVARKSEFYKKLAHTPKVTKIGYSILDEQNNPIKPEKEIDRSEFRKYILRSNKLPTEVIEDAEIEIVAPVLREGNAKWKGIFIEAPPISFEMNDKVFKSAVLSGQISFKNGDVISCILEIHKEISETGEIKITKYSVPTVLDKIEGNQRKETESGKRYRRDKINQSRQRSLNFDQNI